MMLTLENLIYFTICKTVERKLFFPIYNLCSLALLKMDFFFYFLILSFKLPTTLALDLKENKWFCPPTPWM